ncbi:hypothetical protein JKF63_05868 [Porcisia hertigi]|uniref:GPI inositol-deacylase n=1 Tax=Porcisia hertigi TaxID=2761500 RepID=A0A836IJU0_9TRYP|nr:hypothetical protein JKF63_05868 [Porcisia hertigi]
MEGFRTLWRLYHPLGAIQFACVCMCLVLVLSTTSYVVEVRSRSRSRSLSRDYDAIAQTAHRLAASRQLSGDLTTRLVFRDSSVYSAFDPRRLNLTTARPRTKAAALLYGLKQIDCSWFSPNGLSLPLPTAVENTSLLLFFIHGNAGSSTQALYWSCAAQYVSKVLGVQADTFSFDFSEQANVHRGRLVSTQAEYIGDVVEATVQEKRSAVSADVRLQVWLVAHSMGGVVARMAAQLLSPTVVLAGIITFNSPLLFPPLLLDAPMADVYCALTVAEQQPSVDTCASPADGFSLRLTSSDLLRSCTVGDCSVRRSCRRDKTRLISITSGEMDLMIDSTTTYPSAWRSAYIISSYNTLDPAVCGHSISHNEVLHDPCTMVLAALWLVSSSLGSRDGMGDVAERVRDSAGARGGDITADIPLTPAVSLFGYVGRVLLKRHVWPCAAAALYSYLLLSGLHSHMRRMIQMTRRRKKAAWRLLHIVVHRLDTPNFSPIIAVGFFYACTLFYTTLTTAFLWLFGGWESHAARAPWTWACYPQLHASSAGVAAPVYLVFGTIIFIFVSIGPVVLGTLVGVAVVRVVQAIHLLARVLMCSDPLPVEWRAQWLRYTFAPLLILVFAGTLLALGATLTTRALVWLALLVLMPFPQDPLAENHARHEDVAAIVVSVASRAESAITDVTGDVQNKRANRCLPGMLYGAVYVLQLSPFFTVRNAIFSRTFEDADTVDWRNYAAECGVLGLLFAAAVSPRLDCGRVSFLTALSVACLLVALAGVGMIVSHPIESFLVLPALLCCLPVYLYSALFT